MFAQTRWRLVAWTMLVLGVLLLVLGTAVYFAVSRTLLNQVDRNLASRSEQAAPIFEASARGGPPEREGYRGGVFYLLRDPDGNAVANPQRVNVEGVAFPVPSSPAGVFATVTLDGEPTRVYARFVGPRAPPGATLVVGQSLVPEERALSVLILVLVADASHELRTPLTVLRSATDLLNRHRDEPLAKNGALFDDVRSEIGRLERLA